jgi:hypothetical protein
VSEVLALPQSDAAEDAAVRAAFACWFAIERGTCAVLCTLYRAAGRPVSSATLARTAMSTPKAVVNHHVHRLRQALAEEAIDFEPQAGYSLTPIGLAECRLVLRQIGEDLRRAS